MKNVFDHCKDIEHGAVAHPCNPFTWVAEEEQSGVQGQPELWSVWNRM